MFDVQNHEILRNEKKMEFRQLVRERATQRILFLPHAVRQMSRPDRMISSEDMRKVIEEGEIVEDYPADTRGHSCLILAEQKTEDRYILYVHQRMNTWR